MIWTINNSFIKISTDEQNETEQRIHLIIIKTVTVPPHHISLVPQKAINQAISTEFPSEALLEIEENPFLTITKQFLTINKTRISLDAYFIKTRVPSTIYIHTVLWNPSGQSLILKWNMTIGYVKESD